MKNLVIDNIFKTKWQKRWSELSAARFANDYQVAELAKEIREEFPKGDAGDLQFSQWVGRYLRGARPKALLNRIRAFDAFDEKEWAKFGGWQGVQFLMGLSPNQRRKVIEALPGEQTYHYSTIRVRALKLGIVAGRKGRDTRSQSEERVSVLRAFIVDLYRKHKGLPPPPANVKQALTPTVLSAIGVSAAA